MPDEELVVRPTGVKEIKLTDLEPNPHNPRMLFDPIPMSILEENIRKVGVLVPLAVYEKAKQPGKYVILDGQRRWICAEKVGLKKVPVNAIAEPSVFQNIVTMFQIHKLREDWELMPTALKVKVLMGEMKEVNDKKLAVLTGMDEAVIVRCKKLLSFEAKYQEMMLRPDPDQRWKADFFIELYVVRNDRVVNNFAWYKKSKFTDAMIDKYTVGGLKSVTEFRVIKQHISNAAKSNKLGLLSKRLREFVEDPSLKVEHLEIEEAGIAAQVRKMSKDIGKLRQVVSELDVDQYYGEDDFWDMLEKLAVVIQKKLKEVGRRTK
jgi:ParB family transcriptional regulator, chromosome partitioning protein